MIHLFTEIANSLHIPVTLLMAVCFQESTHRNVINVHDGGSASFGICQVKFSTAKLVDKKAKITDLLIPKKNIRFAALYLKKQLVRYEGNQDKAIAAYNAGKVKYNKRGKFVNQKYVDSVKAHMHVKTWQF